MLAEDGKYTLEHRIVAEMVLGRSLTDDEVVHHSDRNKHNNDPANLRVMTRSDHARLHARQRWQSNGNNGRCIICEKWGRPPGVCLECQAEYGLEGLHYSQYPEWVKYLFRARRKDTYRRAVYDPLEVSLDGLIEDGGDIDDHGKAYGCDEDRFTDECLMNYAPYADEVTNREYRRANGIKERKD
ncbi:MAG: HNH endonuclease [Dehalococcoidia bacterium]|jgi:hypothetical protein|nr:HNH endonuclease [Dehalococcoidia bacterium]